LAKTVEDPRHQRGLALDHHQPAVLDFVPERRPAAHPHTLLARCRELVADALADDLALKVGEAEQNVQGQPAHGGRGVELLGDANEGHVVALEYLEQLAKSVSDRLRRSIL
jgi:hypothetical protein